MLHGADHWRTSLDGACGIDIYGHNGGSVGDGYGDGHDDLYVCQPAGLPNRLYRKLANSRPAYVEAHPAVALENVMWREQTFRVIRHPAVTAALA